MREGGSNKASFPLRHQRVGGVLHLAPTAGFEMRTGRFDTLLRRHDDLRSDHHIVCNLARHNFSRQGARHINRARCNSVTLPP